MFTITDLTEKAYILHDCCQFVPHISVELKLMFTEEDWEAVQWLQNSGEKTPSTYNQLTAVLQTCDFCKSAYL